MEVTKREPIVVWNDKTPYIVTKLKHDFTAATPGSAYDDVSDLGPTLYKVPVWLWPSSDGELCKFVDVPLVGSRMIDTFRLDHVDGAYVLANINSFRW